MTAIAIETGREARRTALILAASQAIIGSAAPIAISMGALAGQYLLGADKSLATAPITGFNVGVALGALPAAAIIRQLGQRGGFMVYNAWGWEMLNWMIFPVTVLCFVALGALKLTAPRNART